MKKNTTEQQKASQNPLRNLPAPAMEGVRGGDDTIDVRGSIVDTGKNHHRR
ncbi:MAG TPA: hypothetical protein VOA80_00190 [Thermoanaerobaculia bacterium]|nr:hypothetical protein [Thermoanaerobaculia bacterium]